MGFVFYFFSDELEQIPLGLGTTLVGLLFVVLCSFLMVYLYLARKIDNYLHSQTNYVLKMIDDLPHLKNETVNSIDLDYEFNKMRKKLMTLSVSLKKKSNLKSKYTTKLKIANRQKNDIISSISHEFKNPISIIIGCNEILIDSQTSSQDKEKFLEKISSNANKLNSMVDKLSLAIQLDTNQHTFEFANYNMKDLVDEVADEIQMLYPSRVITKKLEKVSLIVDKLFIQIAIKNLIENAIKYSKGEIFISLNQVQLSIVDYGIGVLAKDINKITKKFYKAKSTWDNSLGMGLYMTKSILQEHNFDFKIYSEYKKGSTFSIVFH